MRDKRIQLVRGVTVTKPTGAKIHFARGHHWVEGPITFAMADQWAEDGAALWCDPKTGEPFPIPEPEPEIEPVLEDPEDGDDNGED